jgi:glutamate dehydrogenase
MTTESSLIGRVEELARSRRPDDPAFAGFVVDYLEDLPEFDLDERLADDLYAAALAHFEFGRVRAPGETLVTVCSPEFTREGWQSDRSVLLIVTDDRPFLVDSVRIALERHHAAPHLLIHPMLAVDRDASGRITATAALDDAGRQPAMRIEAWTQIEIDRCTAETADRVAADVRAAIEAVHRAVDDFAPMRSRMMSLAEVDPLLGWLADGNFVFLGAVTCDLPEGGSAVARPESALGQLAAPGALGDRPDPEIDIAAQRQGSAVSVARSAATATVHRPVRMTVVTVFTTDSSGAPVAERFHGLLASGAYRQSVLTIPSVGDRARRVLGLAHHGSETHAGRAIRNVLEALPRDLVFELDADQLAELVISIVGLQERPIVRAFAVPEPVGSAATVLVYLPKARFAATLPEQVAALVSEAYQSPVRDVESSIGASSLARITLTVTHAGPVDLDAVSDRIDTATTAWIERISEAVRRVDGSLQHLDRVTQVADAAPAEFRSAVDPTTAVGDLDRIAALAANGRDTIAALTRDPEGPADELRVRVYRRGQPLSLSQLLPLLGHLGFETLEEHPYEFVIDGEPYFLLDIGVRLPPSAVVDAASEEQLVTAIDQLLSGQVEADGFNQLVLRAGLTASQVTVLRAYAKYAHQTRFAFSQGYIEGTLARQPRLARLLVEVFQAKFDPDRPDLDVRATAVAAARAEVLAALDGVPSLDDDRICRRFLALIDATVRTSHYQGKPTLALKFDPALVPELPEPRPHREIFVSSPRVEGVHLRGGPIARGGLRWSDRPEDYRTEVLGLVKAQMVKNSVIVPVGAKGGFVLKRPPADPVALRAEVVECYRAFVRGLLDVTDNVVAGQDGSGGVVHPERVVRYDPDDPYLVVAADKGTATFSDVANEVAAEYGFWLGDAFASGGRTGYDHKAMGITARGAWESVRRHGRVLGIDPEADVITVVGIGDMSGDVFGNGLLRSKTVKLIAAFDHRHVFVDPEPDTIVSFAERQRLYDLPRSSWDDYDRGLISTGGGVFPRSLKSITITPQMRRVLGLVDGLEALPPNELISAILRAPVDLLWNGGIGTYVKASSETHAAVGDRANDAVRIDATQLRCRMVAEGGNLGVTQLGRVEYAIGGGLIYTDAIDNSAGVDCSDHEVNLKILLGAAIEAGALTIEQRNDLLADMTDEVAELVLANNKAQTLALMIARTQGLPMVNVHARYLAALEAEGYIDRALEFLPTDKQIAERQAFGSGLRAPEFAVLMAYTKNVNVAEILATDLPDTPELQKDLVGYFPSVLQQRYLPQIRTHRLRREIATTELMNQMVNLSGISYDHRMTEDTGASVSDVARAWLVAREVLGFPDWWDEISALEGLALDDQLDLYLDCRRTAERCSLWFLRHRRPPIDVTAEIARFREPFGALAPALLGALCGPMATSARAEIQSRRVAGVPVGLAERAAVWRVMHTTFDVIETATAAGIEPLRVAQVYWEIFDRLELMWLWEGIGALPRSDRWQSQARGALRDDLLAVLNRLTGSVLGHPQRAVNDWMARNERSVGRALSLLTEIRRADSYSLTNLSVALRTLHNLANMSQAA